MKLQYRMFRVCGWTRLQAMCQVLKGVLAMCALMVSVMALFLLVGCGASAVAPDAIGYIPQHNNIPATFAGEPGGRIIWLCATMPRNYNGRMEEDHYLMYSPCPVTLVP